MNWYKEKHSMQRARPADPIEMLRYPDAFPLIKGGSADPEFDAWSMPGGTMPTSPWDAAWSAPFTAPWEPPPLAPGDMWAPTDTWTTPNMASAANPTWAQPLPHESPEMERWLANSPNPAAEAASMAVFDHERAWAHQTLGADGKNIGLDPATGQLVMRRPDGSWGPFDRNAPAAGGGSIGDMLGRALGGLGKFLGSADGGRLMGTLGMGGLAMGLSALAGRNPSQVRNPALSYGAAGIDTALSNKLLATGQGAALEGLNAGGAAGLAESTRAGLQGQGTLANLLKLQTEQQYGLQRAQQPIEQAIGTLALGQVPGQMNATTNPNIRGAGALGLEANTVARGLTPQAGRIAHGIGGEVENVLGGGYANPILAAAGQRCQ